MYDGPISVVLPYSKIEDDKLMIIKFWAKNVGPNSPLKIKVRENNVFKLLHVMYPITFLPSDKYSEHVITIKIPNGIIPVSLC